MTATAQIIRLELAKEKADTADTAEYRRGINARIDWERSEGTAFATGAPDTPKPTETSPSHFWAGWNFVLRIGLDPDDIRVLRS